MTARDVRAHLEWLTAVTGVDHSACPCGYAWRSHPRLYGQSTGKGWIRMNTDLACPVHGRRE